MTKLNGYLVTMTELKTMGLTPKGAIPADSNYIVSKGEISAAYYVDETALPYATYTSLRCPRYEDIVNTTTTTTTLAMLTYMRYDVSVGCGTSNPTPFWSYNTYTSGFYYINGGGTIYYLTPSSHTTYTNQITSVVGTTCVPPTTTTTTTPPPTTTTSTTPPPTTTTTTTKVWYGYNLTPVYDTTCTASGSDVTAYKDTSGSINIGNVLYTDFGITTLSTGFYSDGTYRYVVNVGSVTDKILCVTTTTTTTAPPTTTTTTTTPAPTTTTTTTILQVAVSWSTIGSAGGSGTLRVNRTSDNLLIFSNTSNSGSQSGSFNLVVGTQYTIYGLFTSGSSNVVRLRVCDTDTGQLGYSGDITAAVGSWSINITPSSTTNIYYLNLTSGSGNTPALCPF